MTNPLVFNHHCVLPISLSMNKNAIQHVLMEHIKVEDTVLEHVEIVCISSKISVIQVAQQTITHILPATDNAQVESNADHADPIYDYLHQNILSNLFYCKNIINTLLNIYLNIIIL